MNLLNATPIEAPVAPTRASRLRTALRAGAPGDGKYVCVVIVDPNGTTGTVCEKVA